MMLTRETLLCREHRLTASSIGLMTEEPDIARMPIEIAVRIRVPVASLTK